VVFLFGGLLVRVTPWYWLFFGGGLGFCLLVYNPFWFFGGLGFSPFWCVGFGWAACAVWFDTPPLCWVGSAVGWVVGPSGWSAFGPGSVGCLGLLFGCLGAGPLLCSCASGLSVPWVEDPRGEATGGALCWRSTACLGSGFCLCCWCRIHWKKNFHCRGVCLCVVGSHWGGVLLWLVPPALVLWVGGWFVVWSVA